MRSRPGGIGLADHDNAVLEFVGTQAVFNVIHGERYAIVPNEVKKYVLGYYGRLLGPVDPNVFDRIVENGTKDIPLKPRPLEPLVPVLRKKYPSASDDELLLRVMFAGNQVDEMKRARGNEQSAAPVNVLEMLKALLAEQHKGRVFIKRRDLELSVTVQ